MFIFGKTSGCPDLPLTKSNPCMLLQEEPVDALIDPITKEWKVHLVRQIFREEEAKLICNIPLSKH
jgi:hypothetical protein